MGIYKRDDKLYRLYYHCPMMYLGGWFEAEELATGKVTKNVDITMFTLVARRD